MRRPWCQVLIPVDPRSSKLHLRSMFPAPGFSCPHRAFSRGIYRPLWLHAKARQPSWTTPRCSSAPHGVLSTTPSAPHGPLPSARQPRTSHVARRTKNEVLGRRTRFHAPMHVGPGPWGVTLKLLIIKNFVQNIIITLKLLILKYIFYIIINLYSRPSSLVYSLSASLALSGSFIYTFNSL